MDSDLVLYEDVSRNIWYIIPGQGATYALSYHFKKDFVINFTKELLQESCTLISYRIQQNIAFFCKDKTNYIKSRNMFDLDYGDTVLSLQQVGLPAPMVVDTPYILKMEDKIPCLGYLKLKNNETDFVFIIHCTPDGKDVEGKTIITT